MDTAPSVTSDVTRAPAPADTARAERPLAALVDRLFIIGLDGATFDVLRPLMDEGRMPHLRQFIEDGTAGVLHSTQPPITPAAWTTFMTGKGPGRHGILDFEKYDATEHRLTFNSTYQIAEKTIWELLGEKGLRVGSINVPMTFPPRPVNGFMISGFETPSVDAEFTYPRDLKQKIFELVPTYNYRTNWQRGTFGRRQLLEENLDYISNSFDQGWRITEFCGDTYGWDVMMTVFKLVDNLQHKAWKYLDTRTRGRFPREAELAARCFTRLDDVLKSMFEYADANNATVLIMSDHGHGSLDGKAQPNLLLNKWGYLTLRSGVDRAMTRAEYWLHRMTKGKATRFEQGSRGIERDLAIDWTRTRACVMHAGIYGYLYINLEGRGPHGIVPRSEYESLRDELIERLRSVTVRDRNGQNVQVFTEVLRPERLYRCNREDNPKLPDLLLVPHPGFAVMRKIRGGQPVRWCGLGRLEGTHRQEGILALKGPNVQAGKQVEANIADITPTTLAALGLRVPVDMEGRVISEAFTTPPVIEQEPPLEKVAEDTREVYSDDEQRTLEQRLSDLGYLE